MYFVVQVEKGKEAAMTRRIQDVLNPEIVLDVFSPIKRQEKKYKGEWHVVETYCFPGYVFVKTKDPRWLAKDLQSIEGYSRVLGVKDVQGVISFVPLSEPEENMFLTLTGGDGKHVVEVSEVEVENGEITKILSGPLLAYRDRIMKIDLHHRYVQVYDHLGEKRTSFQLGIHLKAFHGHQLSDLEYWVG